METTEKQLTTAKNSITKSLNNFAKVSKKHGQNGIISAGIAEGVFEAFNFGELNSENLEFLRKRLNVWHEGNEELLKAFTPLK